MEGEYIDAIGQAGLTDVELISSVDTFAGASGEGNAHRFGAVGAHIRALKPGP